LLSALQGGRRREPTAQMAMIVATGTYDSSDPPAFKAPTWGEVVYQYRMSFIGWEYGESK